jgi:diguanylate cyclase (GGDEF)-like protein
MADGLRNLARQLSGVTGRALARIDVLALFPLTALVAIWLGLDDLVLLTAFLLPALLALRTLGAAFVGDHAPDLRGDVSGRRAILDAIGAAVERGEQASACILLQIDDWDSLTDRWGLEAAGDITARCGDRIATALRPGDVVARLADARFGIVLQPSRSLRLGTREAIVERLRAVLSEPVTVDGTTTRLSVSAGHAAMIREAGDPAAATLRAAEAALAEALRHGPNAVRAFAPAMLQQRRARADLAAEVDSALETGQIRPWFQPQIHANTRVISGFEALARWHHPERGLLGPADFLPAIDDAGRMDALGRVMLSDALDALRQWDGAGLRVPTVAINLSAGELRNPALADHVKWEVDRFDIAPGRLTVEIPETLATRADDDSVIAGIAALGRHGIALDLDDFGIGQASLHAIRRFGIARIKIDRSFIAGLEHNADRQAMVTAILSMARHLGVQTLAEGVEDAATLALLVQMGCDHAQGFHIAAPMPLDETVAWATRHNETLARPSAIGRRAG